MNIPEQAIEAGWATLAEIMECDPDDHGIYELDIMRGLNAALEAAAPFIAAQALREAADWLAPDPAANFDTQGWLRYRADKLKSPND